jgi:hypothetical protein
MDNESLTPKQTAAVLRWKVGRRSNEKRRGPAWARAGGSRGTGQNPVTRRELASFLRTSPCCGGRAERGRKVGRYESAGDRLHPAQPADKTSRSPDRLYLLAREELIRRVMSQLSVGGRLRWTDRTLAWVIGYVYVISRQ